MAPRGVMIRVSGEEAVEWLPSEVKIFYFQ